MNKLIYFYELPEFVKNIYRSFWNKKSAKDDEVFYNKTLFPINEYAPYNIAELLNLTAEQKETFDEAMFPLIFGE